jgi:GntR family transcriptional regulator, transcriptional repressor for pyruvate dehydrogenase complex
MATDYETLIEPVKSKRTFEEVSERLKELIFNGTLRPGEQLPSEVALAQLFHVGRQSVREALRVLEISGFITIRPGVKGGALIEGTMLSKLSGLFSEAFKLNKISLVDCIAARKAIEVSVLDFAFENAGPEDIEALQNNIILAKGKLDSNRPAYEEHLDFHRLLAKASKNYTFSVVVEIILAVFSDFMTSYGLLSLKESRRVIELHEAIVNSLAAKNRAEAEEFLKKDLSVAEKGMLAKISAADKARGRRKKA